MKIAIMGSGGLGGYFGARLAAGGADVHFIARGAHLSAMREHGLAIEGGPNPIRLATVNATDDPATIGPCDVVLFAVKLFDTDSALAQIQPMVGPDTVIVSFQNGVLKDQYIRSAYPAKQSMGDNLIFKLRDDFKQTFVIVTHNEELAQMSDRCLTMEDGVLLK